MHIWLQRSINACTTGGAPLIPEVLFLHKTSGLQTLFEQPARMSLGGLLTIVFAILAVAHSENVCNIHCDKLPPNMASGPVREPVEVVIGLR